MEQNIDNNEIYSNNNIGNINEYKNVPVVALRDVVVFPGTTVYFEVGREATVKAVNEAMHGKQYIFAVAQKDPKVEHPKQNDLFEIGTLAQVKQLVTMPGNVVRVIIVGQEKMKLGSLVLEDGYYKADLEKVEESRQISYDIETIALIRGLKDLFSVYVNERGRINKNVVDEIMDCTDLDSLINQIATGMQVNYQFKQKILAETDIYQRHEDISVILSREIGILRIQDDVAKRVKSQVEENQKEYYLHEQIKAIHKELGDDDSETDADRYGEKLSKLKASKKVKKKIAEEIKRFKLTNSNSSESAVIRGYIETLLSIPWKKMSEDNTDIVNAEKVLNEDHYGLKDVKEKVIECLAVKAIKKDGYSPIICLVGPPGTGKTSIAKSIARAMNRKYIRICLGGVRDEAEIRGHRRTYVGAMPGRIIAGIRSAKVKNPLILFDEIDKMGADYKGDPSSALLEVLDPEQNRHFSDHYVELPVDLSQAMFICTANSLDTIPRPLLDRMEIIELSGYTENEKFHIAKNYLVDKQRIANGLTKEQFNISDKGIYTIIENYTREAGVRGLERKIGTLCRKAAVEAAKDQTAKVRISNRNIKKILGNYKYTLDLVSDSSQVGIVRGLAWTSVGGDTLEIEVNIMHGKGALQLTGKLGDVMQESAKIALSYVKSQVADILEDDFFGKHDIHLHVPEGAVPKDGPSAGITMATAIYSACTGKKVRADAAMTGELTLRGRVLPIGGLKEKILAAKAAGVKMVIVPEKNRKDVEEFDSEVTDNIDIRFVTNAPEVWKLVLES